jgi:hypothetical protein
MFELLKFDVARKLFRLELIRKLLPVVTMSVAKGLSRSRNCGKNQRFAVARQTARSGFASLRMIGFEKGFPDKF